MPSSLTDIRSPDVALRRRTHFIAWIAALPLQTALALSPLPSAIGEAGSSQCTGTVSATPFFLDDFPGDRLDPERWNAHANGGEILVENDAVSLSGSVFPYVTSAGSPIPDSEAFSVRWLARFGPQQSHGTGTLALTRGLPSLGANTWSNVADAWQDGTGYRVQVRIDSITLVAAYRDGMPTAILRDVEYCWLPESIEVWVDGVNVLSTPRAPDLERPAALWFGHPGNFPGRWNSFTLHHVETQALTLDALFDDGFESTR